MYINCHSYNSLRYGTLTVERLSELAAAAGVERLVLTDINNTTGVPDFVRECRSRNITPAAGIEFRDGNRLLYIGIARNNEGFRELNEFLTRHNISGDPLPPCPPSFPNAYVIYPAGGINGYDVAKMLIEAPGAADLTVYLDTLRGFHGAYGEYGASGRHDFTIRAAVKEISG